MNIAVGENVVETIEEWVLEKPLSRRGLNKCLTKRVILTAPLTFLLFMFFLKRRG